MTLLIAPRSIVLFATVLVSQAIVGPGCGASEERADAYGNFEATTTTISAEATGRLLRFDVEEGNLLEAGAVVGLVDTLQLSLKRRQMVAGRRTVLAKTASVRDELGVISEQKQVLLKEKERMIRLLESGAGTTKQLDDIVGQVSILEAREKQIRGQNATILSELEGLEAQVAQIQEQIDRSVIVNPVHGVVLTKYAEPHELTGLGRSLYRIADLSRLTLRAYISGDQLPNVKIGQSVEVQIDRDRTTNRSLAGTVRWIAAEAEFTPKLIQTKEERVNLVYAIKVEVDNPDGVIKIGMPGEVWLRAGT